MKLGITVKTNRSYRLRMLALAGGVLLLSGFGCSKPKPVPLRVDVSGQASPKINPDPAGNPLSVVVRIYQLKDITEFVKLPLDKLSSDRPDAEVFGQDLVSRTEIVAVPGGTIHQFDQIQPGTYYIALVGFFREPDPHFWRVFAYAKDVRQAKSLRFKVQECYLELDGIPAVALAGLPADAKPRCAAAGKAIKTP